MHLFTKIEKNGDAFVHKYKEKSYQTKATSIKNDICMQI